MLQAGTEAEKVKGQMGAMAATRVNVLGGKEMAAQCATLEVQLKNEDERAYTNMTTEKV